MTRPDPDEYVSEHQEQLVRIIKHSSDEFVRALALAALVEYGDEPTRDSVERDLERYLKESE
jgi:hypothetical protein